MSPPSSTSSARKGQGGLAQPTKALGSIPSGAGWDRRCFKPLCSWGDPRNGL